MHEMKDIFLEIVYQTESASLRIGVKVIKNNSHAMRLLSASFKNCWTSISQESSAIWSAKQT